MIDPADQELVLRAIRNASDEQLRQIIDALSTATGKPVTPPDSAIAAITGKRVAHKRGGGIGDARQIPPKS